MTTTLEKLRIDAGLTQKQLAFASKVPTSVISRIEQGNSAHPANLKKLGQFFEVPASELLPDEEKAA